MELPTRNEFKLKQIDWLENDIRLTKLRISEYREQIQKIRQSMEK